MVSVQPTPELNLSVSHRKTDGPGQYRVMAIMSLSGMVRTLRRVGLLTEGAARINPLAFGQTIRLKNYVHHIATHFGLAEVWQFDLAAMLSQLGCVTLPAETLEKVYTGQSLSPEEQQTFLAHPDVGQLLLQHIPRLETIAAMIAGQHRPGPLSASPQTLVQRAPAVLGAHLLKVALGFDQCVMCGMASA